MRIQYEHLHENKQSETTLETSDSLDIKHDTAIKRDCHNYRCSLVNNTPHPCGRGYVSERSELLFIILRPLWSGVEKI